MHPVIRSPTHRSPIHESLETQNEFYEMHIYYIKHEHIHNKLYFSNQFDADKNGHITSKELGDVFMALGESVPGYKIREMIAEVDSDRNGTIEFAEFMHMYTQVTVSQIFFFYYTSKTKP